jgi:gamma-glutamyltranspeptidase/glutathione hydrolase
MSFEPEDVSSLLREPGRTSQVRGKRAVCSTDNAIVSAAILRILEAGGNAIDAAIAGCMVQAAVEPGVRRRGATAAGGQGRASLRRLHR